MKIATSSASFAALIAQGRLTQLEWLDACASELEVDGVVFDAAQFPRTDDDYLAHLKKLATDLGLTVAGYASDALLGPDAARELAVASALGAPLALGKAPARSDDPNAWGAFSEAVKHAAGAAKRANVTLALRAAPGTLCESASDLRRIAKDVDSAWLRFAADTSGGEAGETRHVLLAKTVIAFHATDEIERFDHLERFRGFIVLDGAAPIDDRTKYHALVARFVRLRMRRLEDVAPSAATP